MRAKRPSPRSAEHDPADLDLFIDADDTLWENASFFRAAREHFVELLVARGRSAEDVQEALHDHEARGLAAGQFGSARLGRSMVAAAADLLECRGVDLAPQFESLVHSIRNHHIHFYEGVLSTLEALGRRHRLHLVTMGEHEEQRLKLERSGVLGRFATFEILADKTPHSYEELLELREISSRDTTWMIGNSRVKDIAPAHAVGLSTVLIDNGAAMPAYFTDSDVDPDVVLPRFADLLEHF